MRELLSDKTADEIPIVSIYPLSALLQLAMTMIFVCDVLLCCDHQIVENIISKVKEEFERRLERQTKLVCAFNLIIILSNEATFFFFKFF